MKAYKKLEATFHYPEITKKAYCYILVSNVLVYGVLPDKKERLELKRIKKFFHAHFSLNNGTH
jgi:hypothetical protein